MKTQSMQEHLEKSVEAIRQVRSQQSAEVSNPPATSEAVNETPTHGSNESSSGGNKSRKPGNDKPKAKVSKTDTSKANLQRKQPAKAVRREEKVKVTPMVHYDTKSKLLTLDKQSIISEKVFTHTEARISLEGLDESTIQLVVAVAKLTSSFTKLQDVLHKPEREVKGENGTKSVVTGKSAVQKAEEAIVRLSTKIASKPLPKVEGDSSPGV